MAKDKDKKKSKKKPTLDPSTSVKDKELYDKLRDEGVGKKKSVAVVNAISAESRSKAAAKGGSSPPYHTWSRADLYEKAKQLDIAGRSGMGKDELIAALRNN